MIDIKNLTIKGAREALKRGDYTSRELTEACILNIKEKNEELNAFIEIYDDALAQADEADKQISSGVDKPLLGIPLALKDNILRKGFKATSASKILDGYIATYDSFVVKKLYEAGAILVGRTNMDEFAMGSSTESSYYGPTFNPYDTTRVPGGSSGGSAVAVAAGMVLGSLGSDTAGSIRQPAAFCGLVGLKTTYGRVSRSGLMALTSSIDQIGPFAKTIEDAELIYEVIKGKDPLDSTSISDDAYPPKRKSGKVLGIPKKFVDSEGVSSEVKRNFQEAVARFESLGYSVKEIEMPLVKYSLPVYYIITPAEVSSNLARFDGVKFGLHIEGDNSIDDYFKTRGQGFGKEVRRRLLLGAYVLSSGYYDAYYGTAIEMKNLIMEEMRKTFKEVDIILTPTSPTPAFKIGEKTDPLSLYLSDIFTVPANIANCPSISLPSGFVETDGKELPLGIELTSDLGREDIIFKAGKEFLGEK